METPHLALGSVQRQQLVKLLDAARAEGSANVIVSCGKFAVELSFGDNAVFAETALDTGDSAEARLELEDEAVLLILGWRRENSRGPFLRDWHPTTSSDDIADDIVRTARHAYRCEADRMKVLLRMREPTAIAN